MRTLILLATFIATGLVLSREATAEETFREQSLSHWRQKLRDPLLLAKNPWSGRSRGGISSAAAIRTA